MAIPPKPNQSDHQKNSTIEKHTQESPQYFFLGSEVKDVGDKPNKTESNSVKERLDIIAHFGFLPANKISLQEEKVKYFFDLLVVRNRG